MLSIFKKIAVHWAYQTIMSDRIYMVKLDGQAERHRYNRL